VANDLTGAELAFERSRQTSVDQRAIAILASAGVAVGFAVVLRQPVAWPLRSAADCASLAISVVAVATAALLVVTAVLAAMVLKPISQEFMSEGDFRTVFEQSTLTHAEASSAKLRHKYLQSTRAATSIKVARLKRAVRCAVASLVLLVVVLVLTAVTTFLP